MLFDLDFSLILLSFVDILPLFLHLQFLDKPVAFDLVPNKGKIQATRFRLFLDFLPYLIHRSNLQIRFLEDHVLLIDNLSQLLSGSVHKSIPSFELVDSNHTFHPLPLVKYLQIGTEPFLLKYFYLLCRQCIDILDMEAIIGHPKNEYEFLVLFHHATSARHLLLQTDDLHVLRFVSSF